MLYPFANAMKRAKKSPHPFAVIIQDCLLRARSLCSVNPIVRDTREGLGANVFDSLIAAGVFSVRLFFN